MVNYKLGNDIFGRGRPVVATPPSYHCALCYCVSKPPRQCLVGTTASMRRYRLVIRLHYRLPVAQVCDVRERVRGGVQHPGLRQHDVCQPLLPFCNAARVGRSGSSSGSSCISDGGLADESRCMSQVGIGLLLPSARHGVTLTSHCLQPPRRCA
jgi:hypothetical protein